MTAERVLPIDFTPGVLETYKERAVPHPLTLAFLKGSIESGLFAGLIDEQRLVLERYYFTPGTTLTNLIGTAGTGSRTEIKQLILSSITTLWSSSPREVKQLFPKKKVVRLKNPAFSDEHRSNLSAMRKGKPNPNPRGYRRTLENKKNTARAAREVWRRPGYRERISEIMKTVKGTPEARRATSEAIREFHVERRLWEYVVKNSLMLGLASSGLVSEAEVVLLRRHFNEDPAVRRRHLPEDIFDRLSLVVANLA